MVLHWNANGIYVCKIVDLCLSFFFPSEQRATKRSRENACWPISNKLKIWECDGARNKLRRIGMLGIDLKLWGVTSRDRPLSQFGIWGPPPPPLLLRSSSFWRDRAEEIPGIPKVVMSVAWTMNRVLSVDLVLWCETLPGLERRHSLL